MKKEKDNILCIVENVYKKVNSTSSLQSEYTDYLHYDSRGVGTEGGGGVIAISYFGRSVNPISTRDHTT